MWDCVKKFYKVNLLVKVASTRTSCCCFFIGDDCTMDWIGNVRVLKYTHRIISYLHKSCCHIVKGWKGKVRGQTPIFWSSKNWSWRGGWTHKEFAKSHLAPMGASSIAQSSQNNRFTQSKYNTHQRGQRDVLHTKKRFLFKSTKCRSMMAKFTTSPLQRPHPCLQYDSMCPWIDLLSHLHITIFILSSPGAQ
jgi:hypothetical protein